MIRTFTFRLLDFFCVECKKKAEDFTKIAVTDEVELYVAWVCAHCHQEKFAVVPLEEIAKQKPEHQVEVGKPTTNELAMLAKAHILWD